MGYRFQTLTTLYPEFISQFLRANPDHSSLSFEQLHERLIDARYWSSDFYTRHMRALGNESQDLFISLKPLQAKWARENGIVAGSRTLSRDITVSQVREFKPDVIFIQDLYAVDGEFRDELRAVCGPRTLIVGWRSAPTAEFSELRDLDLALSAFPHFVEALRREGIDAEYLPLAFETSLVEEVDTQGPRDLGFTFVGQLGSEHGPHDRRHQIVKEVMRDAPLEVWTEEWTDRHVLPELIGAKLVYRANRLLSAAGVSPSARSKVPLLRRGIDWDRDLTRRGFFAKKYPDRRHSAVFGLDYYNVLARSKVTLNTHIDAAQEWASNMRLYEATGMGACLITDWKPNLADLFVLDDEVVTYRTAEECSEKTRYLLEHDAEREKIARAGQLRTLNDHTFARRVERLNELILDRR